ncbi:ABC transporter permease [Jeotgalibacillus salarius]|uniref:FtsX-like permease family protein n=1 Tax=Jeotgalibacillus salarius TaxID=546023 RepID=A0A4Y8LN68_9BACL|nr:ABC transporter permease [Jeotgalibacillus salarius]TFE02193.1 FtsX-like permease family protein [Jeotgalibacillus salarius]
MKLKDQFRFIQQNMKKNKMRVSMTILASAMSVAFLIVLASVAFGLHDTVIKDTIESPEVTQIEVAGKDIGNGNAESLSNEDIEQIEALEGVNAVTRSKQVRQETRYITEGYEINTQTIQSHFPSMKNAGMDLGEGAFPEEKDEVAVGYHFALNLLKDDVDPEEAEYGEDGHLIPEQRFSGEIIGQTFDLEFKRMQDGEEITETVPVTVTGVIEKPGREWAWDQNVYITDEKLAELEAITGTSKAMLTDPADAAEDTGYDSATVYADDLETVKSVMTSLEEEGYFVYSMVSEMSQINTLFNIAKAGLIFIGTIAILIASIGIFNTMTMAVTERAPDIGIMKAIGASPKVIKRIFLLESTYIGLIGAVIGIAVSYVISIGVNLALPLILESAFDEELPQGLQFSSIPFSLVLIAVAICLIVTMLSGMRPAKRATEIDVLKAMRREV